MDTTNKLIITKWKQGILSMLMENDHEIELQYEISSNKIIGNIYIAKVHKIIKNIQAAFVEITPGTMCYLSMKDAGQPIYLNRVNQNIKDRLVQGDEILVQVIKDKIKTKEAVVTTNLSLAGRYVVLTTGNQRVGISTKIEEDKREAMRTELDLKIPKDTGVVIRTNAQYATKEEIQTELNSLSERLFHVLEMAKHRTCYSMMYRTQNQYLNLLRDIDSEKIDEIVTDDEEIFHAVTEQLVKLDGQSKPAIRHYQDELLPLEKLYSIETRIQKALNKRVWLKSGGYLVIEPTEALTVIDVNTGKYDGKKNLRDTFMKINMEAAMEAARQIRLRNISGIIIIDFINLRSKQERDLLMETMRNHVSTDKIQTEVHDLTALSLMELTRKKVNKPLCDLLNEQDTE